MKHIINHSELKADWNWLAESNEHFQLDWQHSTQQSWPRIMQLPAGVMIARICAAAKAVSLANQSSSILVSHGPRPAMYASLLSGKKLANTPHLAFSFNFTKLPSSHIRKLMVHAFKKIDRFTVFSTMEKDLYANFFDLDRNLIDILPWAVKPYQKDKLARPVSDAHYICAIGSQGRDYQVLMEAMRTLPACRLHLVAYSKDLVGLKIPDNVTVHQAVPFDFAAALVAHADAMILPLLGAEVPCGHVTAVMAMHLGIPILATDSIGLHDYLRQDETAILFQPNSAKAIKLAVTSFLDDPTTAINYATNAQKYARQYCIEARTIEYFKNFIQKYNC